MAISSIAQAPSINLRLARALARLCHALGERRGKRKRPGNMLMLGDSVRTKPRLAKGLALLSFLLSLGSSLTAQSRQLTQIGGGLYWDQADPGAGPGHSLYARDFTFFDARYPDGFYWGLLANADIHQRGTTISLDDHLLTLGWWGHPLSRFPIILNANVSPVLGIRAKGTSYLGDNYWGVGAALGTFVNLLPSISFGLSWEPVWILSDGGGQPAPDKTYNEFGLSIVIKQLYW